MAIVNYGSGNIRAISNIYGRLGVAHVVAATPEDLTAAHRIILPGVGAFDQAMGALNASGMRDALEHAVHERGTPLLGICVGMQLLARRSDEGQLAGLGWIAGEVRRFAPAEGRPALPLPHMGWNDVRPAKDSPLFEGVDLGNGCYFLHSFYLHCDRPEDALAHTSYGVEFASAASVGHVHGVQFHPEKSHQAGVQLLANFARA